jgi:hypothetical protein
MNNHIIKTLGLLTLIVASSTLYSMEEDKQAQWDRLSQEMDEALERMPETENSYNQAITQQLADEGVCDLLQQKSTPCNLQ